MADHAPRLRPQSGDGRAGWEGDRGQAGGRAVVTGLAANHRLRSPHRVHLAGRSAISTEVVDETLRAVATRAAGGNAPLGVPVAEGFGREVSVRPSGPGQ